MKKLFLALLFIVGSMGYIVVQRGLDEQATNTTTTAVETSSDAIPVSKASASVNTAPAQTTTSTSVATTPVTSPKKGQYSNGTFTGAAFNQPYGTVQVAVVVSGGRISQVKLLQTPNGGGQTEYINQQALPLLVQEVISAQSGNIDGVSGASLTSPAFIDSVNSALAIARA